MTDITSPPDVAGTTTTAGTGAFVISGAIAVPGGGGANYRLWSGVATGSRVHCIRQDAGGANFERGIADVTISAGVATLSWNPRIETSAGGNSPVSWPGGGQQDVWVLGGSIHAANGGIEFSPYAATFRTNIGLASASTHPSERFGLVPAGAGVDAGWTGGTSGKVVRYSSANTFADASNTDTVAQLSLLAYKDAQGYQFGPRLITGLTGLTAGSIYYLGTAGAWTTTQPTVTAGGSTKLVVLGIAPSTTSLAWNPQLVGQG